MTATRAARHLGIGTGKTKWLISEALAGRLPHVNCGGVPLFDLEALRSALAEQAMRPAIKQIGMAKTFVDLQQLTQSLGLPSAWLKSEAVAGRIPALRAGKRWAFSEPAVRAALLERTGGE
jgi:hypothetical protein